MKQILNRSGIALLICAVLLFGVAAIVQEQTKPIKVTTGVMINGEFKATNSGYMGGNAKAQEDMGWLKGIAVVFGLVGAGMTVGSQFVKEEEKPKY